MNIKHIHIFFVFLLSFGLLACDDLVSLVESHDDNLEYAPGQISVGFVDTVSYKFATNFCTSQNLEILRLRLGHNFWAEADSNDLEYYRNIFSSDSSVEYLNELSSVQSEDTLLITITFTGINRVKHDLQKVEAIGLNVYKISEHPKSALLKTEVGEEKCWIDKLNTYNFVRYAEYNVITHIYK